MTQNTPGEHVTKTLKGAIVTGRDEGFAPRTTRRYAVNRTVAITATLSAAALVLAACSSAAKTTSSGSAGAPTTSGSSSAPGLLDAASIKTIAAYTGSKPGKADSSLKPVTWGYVNQQGGVPTFPQYTKQVDALVTVVNNQLGGIDGHPLKLVQCYVVSSDEDGQACGQKFANDKTITTILQYPLINGDSAFHQIVDKTGVPVFGPSANSIADATAKNDFFTTGPNFSNVPVLASYTAKTLKAKTVAILGIQGDPLSQLIDGQLTAAFKAAGVTAKLATVSPTSSDVTAPLVAAGVQHADAIVATLASAPLCASVAKALNSLGASKVPVVSTQFCSSDDTKALLGDYPKWTFVGGYPDPRAPSLDSRESAELAVAQDLFTATGSSKGDLDYASPSLQAFLTAVTVVTKAGGAAATASTIEAAALAFTGPLFLGEDTVSWGKIKGLPAVGTLAQRIYTYTGNGKWIDAGHGWYEPPTTGS
jgi:branched-chain amino acid transport system substrate-binding protein